MPRRIADLIKQGDVQRILTLLCRRTSMFLCFNWKVFKYIVVFSLECIKYLYTNAVQLYVDMIYRNKIACLFNYMYGKTYTINV